MGVWGSFVFRAQRSGVASCSGLRGLGSEVRAQRSGVRGQGSEVWGTSLACEYELVDVIRV